MKIILQNSHAEAQRRKGPCGRPPKNAFAPLRLCVSFFLLIFPAGAFAQTTNGLSDAEIQGRALAQKILEQQPTENFTQNGVLKIRDDSGNSTNFFILFQTRVNVTEWQAVYIARPTVNDEPFVELKITHANTETKYALGHNPEPASEVRAGAIPFAKLDKSQITKPFMNSDFWLCDLGLEFFHWPEQTVLKKKINQFKGRDYTLLESTNPQPSTNGYSRVVSWIDNETLGLLQADAYDHDGKLLKEFYPKDFKKVNGQWQVQTLVMENEQTGSRSRLEFDLK